MSKGTRDHPQARWPGGIVSEHSLRPRNCFVFHSFEQQGRCHDVLGTKDFRVLWVKPHCAAHLIDCLSMLAHPDTDRGSQLPSNCQVFVVCQGPVNQVHASVEILTDRKSVV